MPVFLNLKPMAVTKKYFSNYEGERISKPH
jgi:hypothetical protein